MFEAVCSTDNPVEVWCMFKKSEVNVSSFAAVIGVVDFLWTVVSMVVGLSFKSVINHKEYIYLK